MENKSFIWKRMGHSFVSIRYDIFKHQYCAIAETTHRLSADVEMIRLHSHEENIRQLCDLMDYFCSELLHFLTEKRYKQAYDFIDAIHCLPDILIQAQYSIPLNYMNIYINPYCVKWGDNLDQKIKQIAPNAIKWT